MASDEHEIRLASTAIDAPTVPSPPQFPPRADAGARAAPLDGQSAPRPNPRSARLTAAMAGSATLSIPPITEMRFHNPPDSAALPWLGHGSVSVDTPVGTCDTMNSEDAKPRRSRSKSERSSRVGKKRRDVPDELRSEGKRSSVTGAMLRHGVRVGQEEARSPHYEKRPDHHGDDQQRTDDWAEGALHVAAAKGDAYNLSMLIGDRLVAGWSPAAAMDGVDGNAWTALHYACQHGGECCALDRPTCPGNSFIQL
jgi:hypothetical protein